MRSDEVFDDPAFRADLAALAESSREVSRRLAAELVVLARLARQVPRVAGDESGPTTWVSFLREVAVAKRCSDRAAAADVQLAVRLVEDLPSALRLLGQGAMPVPQLRALVELTWGCARSTLTTIDGQVSERACRLSPSRVRDAVRKVVLRCEADLVAARAAAAASRRGVRLTPLRDDQAELGLAGPVLPLARALAALDTDARALRAAGDRRRLDALRFDLAVDRLLAGHTQPAPPDTPAPSGSPAPPAEPRAGAADAPATGRGTEASPCGCTRDGDGTGSAWAAVPGAPVDPTVPGWLTDRRCSRPVQLLIQVPVTTALGLTHEPGWLDGYGWISAPTVRQLLPVAELRQLCVAGSGPSAGQPVDLAPRPVRPDPTPAGARAALVAMAGTPFDITDVPWRSEPRHDPSPPLREFVELRDVWDDGPTGPRISARRADKDHEVPYPHGPTAAWNLACRGRRTHLLKHAGWTPVRSATGTLWFSPAGQVYEVERPTEPPHALDLDAEPDLHLPDPDEVHQLEAELLRPLADDERRPFTDVPAPF